MTRGALLGLAAAGLLAMPAVAQPPPGPRLDPAPGAVRQQDALDQVTAQRAMRTFAACLVRNHARIANEILLQPLASEAQQEVINRRVGGVSDCTGAGSLNMGFNVLILAGALAEASLPRFAGDDLGRVSGLTADRVAILNLEPRTGYEDLGLCVARRAPEAVMAWALSEPGSEVETAARRTIIPLVGPCVNQGQPLRADAAGLRAILSAGLYRALRMTRP